MSPEIVNEESHDYGVDIWCLGILLYEMLHGNPPFNAENLGEIKKEFQKKKIQVDPKFDKDTIDLIDQLLQYNSDDRISIEEALNHRAIKKNYKSIIREITQEEYNLLTRYYYMNSGGNQLMTHNSTYARQLKRQSMLTKKSHSSYHSTNSSMFDSNSKGGPNDFMKFDKPPDRNPNFNMDHFSPMDLKNNFSPNVMGGNVISATIDSENVEMSNKLANSAFKKKDEHNNDIIEVAPASNLDTKVSERSLDFFKKNEQKDRKVQTPNPEDIKFVDPNILKKDVPVKSIPMRDIKKVENQKKSQNNIDVKKKEIVTNRSNSKVKEKADVGSKKKNKDRVKSSKKLSNIKRQYTNISKPQNEQGARTTLEEFRKKYNPEKFKEKFQNEKSSKSEKNKNKKYQPKKIISTGNIIRMKNKDNKVDNVRKKNNVSTDKNKINSTINKSKNLIKSPTNGPVFISSKNFKNVTNTNSYNKPVINNIRTRSKTPERTKVTSNLTSISKPIEQNIFKTMDSDANKTKNKPMAEFKSVTHGTKHRYNSPTVTENTSRSRDIRTEVQRVREGTNRSTKRETSVGRNERFNTTIVRIQTSVDRYSKINKYTDSNVMKTVEYTRDEGHRYSLGVRSRTLDKKPVTGTPLDQNKKSAGVKESNNKLSQIFEEPSPSKFKPQNKSLYTHLKQNSPKYVNMTHININDQKTTQEINNRSKSTEIKVQDIKNGQFNRRVVYVNGIKTEKMIYSKSNNDSTRNSRKKINKKENEIKKETPKEEIKETKEEKKPEVENKESEKKKKYKIITVPQTKARVIQEGGLKFSNVKPITIIQQGNFALSSSRSKNKSMNYSSRNLDQEDNVKKEPERERERESKELDMITIKTENEKGDTSVTKKRVISYQEYKRRIQKTLQENQEKKVEVSQPEQKKIMLKNNSTDNPKTLIEQYNNLSNQNKNGVPGKQVFVPTFEVSNKSAKSKGPVITRLTRTISKPYLETEKENSTRTKEKSIKGEDNINTLVKKLEQINQNEENPKSKTTGSISLNQLIRQVKHDDTNKFQYSYNHDNQSFGHKKNKTMYNLNQNETKEYVELHRVKSGSSNQKSHNIRQVSVPKKTHVRTMNYTREEYSKSSKRNYNRYQPNNNTVNKVNTVNPVKIYKNNDINLPPNSYKTTSRRTIDQDWTERYSYGRRAWQNQKPNLKESNSVKRFNHKNVNNINLNTVYNNNNNNYSLNINNAKLKPGNVTTTVRRYVINTSPVNNFHMQHARNGVSNGNGDHKKQIYTNFKELKKNLKTNFYN